MGSCVLLADLGATRCRFAISGESGLQWTANYDCGAFSGIEDAIATYAGHLPRPLPDLATIAVAGPVKPGRRIRLTNRPWVLDRARLKIRFGFRKLRVLNDFEAVAAAVSVAGPEAFSALKGAMPDRGLVTIVGPGTGLGVAILDRRRGRARVIPTEGGHMAFAACDAVEDAILADLRGLGAHVPVEAVAAGPGLARYLAALGGPLLPDREAWSLATETGDFLAAAALDRWMGLLGRVSGDLALAQGADAVVLAGALVARIGEERLRDGFLPSFEAKGVHARHLSALPVLRLTLAEPALTGAAARS
jgi:glucokinase